MTKKVEEEHRLKKTSGLDEFIDDGTLLCIPKFSVKEHKKSRCKYSAHVKVVHFKHLLLYFTAEADDPEGAVNMAIEKAVNKLQTKERYKHGE